MQAQDRMTDIKSKAKRQPAVFIGHGSPLVTIEFDSWNESVCKFFDEEIPRPNAIAIMSAHWNTGDSIEVTSASFPSLIYDFERDENPDTLFQLTYPCEGQPELANEIVYNLTNAGFKSKVNPDRGLDSGAWAPMYVIYPDMEIPIVEISLPSNLKPRDLYNIGKAISMLRDRGVLLIGSGNIVNNKKLAYLEDKYAETDGWAFEIDGWVDQQLKDFEIDKLLDFESQAPHTDKAIANKSHLYPLFFILGAIMQKDHYYSLFDGFHYGNISMRSFAFISKK